MTDYTLRLHDAQDEAVIGGKGASLARMISHGFPVPSSFSVTSHAYRDFISANKVAEAISSAVMGINSSDYAAIEQASRTIQKQILNAPILSAVESQIRSSYVTLMNLTGHRPVSVRSSATAEDLTGASFAGQYDTYLNIVGEDSVVQSVKKCWASLWNSSAMLYRVNRRFSPEDVLMAVVVQEMIPATTSGVMFTANPVTGDTSEIVINSCWGLGEAVVSGIVTPDHIAIEKSTGEIRAMELASKDVMVVADGSGTIQASVPPDRIYAPSLSEAQIDALIRMGMTLESSYGAPQDVEWCFEEDRLSLLQSRPITTL